MRTERRLLHAVFQQAPVPLFLLEQDGTIRRANNKAAELLGAPSGYATGKTLAAFVDLPTRAAVQTQFAAALRTGKPRTARCRILTADGPLDATLTAVAADLPGDPPVLIVTASRARRRGRRRRDRGRRGQAAAGKRRSGPRQGGGATRRSRP